MSWLSKVTDMAGKAEEMLNRFDQSAGEVITQTKDNIVKVKSSQSSSNVNLARHEEMSGSITEQVGSSMPSHTQSEYVGGAPPRRKLQKEIGSSPSTSRLSRDDHLMAMLASEQPGERGETQSQRGMRGREEESWTSAVQQPGFGNAPSESRSRRSSSHSIASMAASESTDGNLRTQLLAKDSQLTMLRNKLNETEKKLEKRSEELWDLKREKESLAKELEQKSQPMEGVEELRLARQKAVEAREAVVEESGQLRKRVVGLEEENGTISDQLRLAKFNLAENKREFDEYKEKAKKILQAKEKLVESLKQDNNPGDGAVLQAEVEEIKVERDMARADLESCQLQLYNLRSEMEEHESRVREQQRELADQRRVILEERSQWNATIQLLNEKIECAKIEQEFVRGEMRRQELDFQRKIEERDTELRRVTEEQRSRRREEEYRSGGGPGDMASAEKLLQKQTDLEQALRDNQVLTLRLERLQKNSRETVIQMGDAPVPPSLRGSIPVQNPAARQALSLIDTICLKFISMLRNYPASRLFIAVYFVVLHLWAFFIVLTYTPEIHP